MIVTVFKLKVKTTKKETSKDIKVGRKVYVVGKVEKEHQIKLFFFGIFFYLLTRFFEKPERSRGNEEMNISANDNQVFFKSN